MKQFFFRLFTVLVLAIFSPSFIQGFGDFPKVQTGSRLPGVWLHSLCLLLFFFSSTPNTPKSPQTTRKLSTLLQKTQKNKRPLASIQQMINKCRIRLTRSLDGPCLQHIVKLTRSFVLPLQRIRYKRFCHTTFILSI